MSKLIKITYFPKFINKITSFHKLSNDESNLLNNIVNEEHFFIENFFRISKNLYEHLSNENLLIEEVTDDSKVNILVNYLEEFNNDFNLYEMITYSYKSDSESIYSLSDEELADTVNILRIFESNLKENNENVKDILEKNPHLLEDDTVTECLKDI